MPSFTRLAVAVAAILLSGAALPAQKSPKETPSSDKFKEPRVAEKLKEPARPPAPKTSRDLLDALYPPELVMEHQNELGLSEAERQTLRQSVQQAQSKFIDLQWRLSAETERLATLLKESSVDERQVLEQVDRVLALERELKRTQIGLLVRIKNALTPEQQRKLNALGRRKG
jgi:Spy/CpxP family protein refolding chaperone